MTGLRHHAMGRLGSLLGAALILVPLVLGGHRHRADLSGTSRACAICVATHHSPAAAAPPLPQLAPALQRLAVASPQNETPVQTYRSFKAGRAPPLLLTTPLV